MSPALLPTLWAQALVGLARDYEAERAGPSLPLWSNLLRIVDAEGIALRDAPRLARLSRRAMGPLLGSGEARGLVVIDRSAGGRRATVHLTAAGGAARDGGRAGLARTEAAWARRFGQPLARLRDGLEDLVGRFDLELPHFPMVYGPADARITGGWSVAGHGQDWRPVARDGTGTADGLPLAALLSQALVAFAIDVESEPAAGLPLLTASVLVSIGDEGVPEARLPPVVAWRPAPGTITGGPGALGRGKVVRLTAGGRERCDRYLALAAAVEGRWRVHFGAGLIDALRPATEAIAGGLDPGLPPYVVVPWIGGMFSVHGAGDG